MWYSLSRVNVLGLVAHLLRRLIRDERMNGDQIGDTGPHLRFVRDLRFEIGQRLFDALHHNVRWVEQRDTALSIWIRFGLFLGGIAQ